MRLFGGVLFLVTTASFLSAGIVNYNGDIMPGSDPGGYGFPSQVIFGDTQMTTDGSALKMATVPYEGVWFGASSGMALSGSGNYVSLDTRVSLDATDWYLYFGDGANFAEFKISADSFSYHCDRNCRPGSDGPDILLPQFLHLEADRNRYLRGG